MLKVAVFRPQCANITISNRLTWKCSISQQLLCYVYQQSAFWALKGNEWTLVSGDYCFSIFITVFAFSFFFLYLIFCPFSLNLSGGHNKTKTFCVHVFFRLWAKSYKAFRTFWLISRHLISLKCYTCYINGKPR